MLWESACVTDHTVISNQFVVVASSVVGDGMRRAGIMAAGLQFSFSIMRQTVRELFNVANMRIHVFSFLLAVKKYGDGQSPCAVSFLHDIPLVQTCQVDDLMCGAAGTPRKRPRSATSVSRPANTSGARGSNGSTFTVS